MPKDRGGREWHRVAGGLAMSGLLWRDGLSSR